MYYATTRAPDVNPCCDAMVKGKGIQGAHLQNKFKQVITICSRILANEKLILRKLH